MRNGRDGLRATADDAWGAVGEAVAADAAAAADALLAAAIAAHDRGAPPDAEALGVPGAGAGMAAGIVALADGEAAAPGGEAALTAGNTVAAGTGVVGGFCDDETLLLVLLAYAVLFEADKSMLAPGRVPLGRAPLTVGPPPSPVGNALCRGDGGREAAARASGAGGLDTRAGFGGCCGGATAGGVEGVVAGDLGKEDAAAWGGPRRGEGGPSGVNKRWARVEGGASSNERHWERV